MGAMVNAALSVTVIVMMIVVVGAVLITNTSAMVIAIVSAWIRTHRHTA